MVQEDLGCLLSLSNNKIVIGITHREEKYSEGESEIYYLCQSYFYLSVVFLCFWLNHTIREIAWCNFLLSKKLHHATSLNVMAQI